MVDIGDPGFEKAKAHLRSKLFQALKNVTEENLSPSYDYLASIILSEKASLSVKEVQEVITELDNTLTWNDLQEDVLLEIGNRLSGNCPDFKKLSW